MDVIAFPAWMDVGSFGGLTCAVAAAAALAIWALVYHRGTARQSALAILICLACAALMIFPVWWGQSRFQFFESSLDSSEIILVLIWTALFGWTLPLGMLASYMALAETPLRPESSTQRRSPLLEATLRLALTDPVRYASVRKDDAPWAQLAVVNDENNDDAQPLMLRKRLTLIGREVDNDIVLNDQLISRHHAEIRLDHNAAVLLDYGSMNGTTINKQPVIRPVPLKPGDIVELGARRYRFSLYDGPALAYEADTSKMSSANGKDRRQTIPPFAPPALVATRGEAEGSRWELREPVVNIGRDATCQIRLPDTTVSRRHAQVVRQTDGYYASDLESINGTKINDDDLITPRRLRNGDLLHVGAVALRFEATLPEIDAPHPSGDIDDELQPRANGVSPSQTTVPLAHSALRRAAEESQLPSTEPTQQGQPEQQEQPS